MVRTAAVAFLLFSGCSSPISSASDQAEVADVNARNALAKVAELERRIDDLEQRLEDQEGATRQSADAIAGIINRDASHIQLFNSNVDISNKREAAQERDIDWLMQQYGVYRNRN